MEKREEILKRAKERIKNLEYFDVMVGLAPGKQADLALIKELVALVEKAGEQE